MSDNKSIWQGASLPEFPQLRGDIKTGVLVIGGGIAGILTAHFLGKAGVDYVLLEKGRICGGTTCDTTAKITVQHGLIFQKIVKSYGAEAARMYLGANEAAFAEFARLCGGIDCGYEVRDNYVYSVSDERKLYDEMAALDAIGREAELCRELPIPIKAAGAVKFRRQAQFDVLKFLAEVARGMNIYERSFVREMAGNTAVTDEGRVEAEAVVCATHFPFINKHGAYFLKMYQHRTYMTALDGAPELGGMFVDENHGGFTFRNYGGALILGGAGARTGTHTGGWGKVRDFARRHYPNAREICHWAAQDCMTLDGMPYVGRYSRATENFYVATGFNKWGMTGAMSAAMTLCDAITGKENGYGEVFDPSRSILKPQLAVNAIEAVKGLVTISKKRCPHLGCALKHNGAEHSWDCACHGSRFDEDGTVLDNPANGNLR